LSKLFTQDKFPLLSAGCLSAKGGLMMGTKKVGALSSPLKKNQSNYSKKNSIVKKKIILFFFFFNNCKIRGILSNLSLT